MFDRDKILTAVAVAALGVLPAGLASAQTDGTAPAAEAAPAAPAGPDRRPASG